MILKVVQSSGVVNYSDIAAAVSYAAAEGAQVINLSLGGYAGTSPFAPFVSGLAGLLRNLHPQWSPALVRQQILNTTDVIDSQNQHDTGQVGSGRVTCSDGNTWPPGRIPCP